MYTYLIPTRILFLSGTLLLLMTFQAVAQNPADFFDYEREQRMLDSLYINDPTASREEVRQVLEGYHRKQADAYYRAYRRRLGQQEQAKKLLPKKLRNQLATQNAVSNSSTSEGQVPDAVERAALVALYNATGGSNWTHSDNWLQGTTSSDFGNWYGVSVQNGDIVRIVLTYNNLQGALPSEFGNLSNLNELYLRGNQLNTLPAGIGNLSSLTHLDLQQNQLSSLPPEIGNLSSLTYLFLIFNQLSSLPPEIGNLSSLNELYFNYNQLNFLPPEIANLSSLTYLSFHENQLSSLPTEIGNLSSLNVSLR